MHVDPPKEFPIECAMELASAARNGTVFDTPRESFVHAWNLLGWGGGTFIPEEGFGSAHRIAAARPLSTEERQNLLDLKSALDGMETNSPAIVGGPLNDFFSSFLTVLLAQLQEWLGGVLG